MVPILALDTSPGSRTCLKGTRKDAEVLQQHTVAEQGAFSLLHLPGQLEPFHQHSHGNPPALSSASL